jgi:hypothetical protein
MSPSPSRKCGQSRCRTTVSGLKCLFRSDADTFDTSTKCLKKRFQETEEDSSHRTLLFANQNVACVFVCLRGRARCAANQPLGGAADRARHAIRARAAAVAQRSAGRRLEWQAVSGQPRRRGEARGT